MPETLGILAMLHRNMNGGADDRAARFSPFRHIGKQEI
jgi:hypothetical protein|tara:strand:- start:7977 stop:8090 length:114 start_codon:yes stop_codon:yes gene_type:complete